MRMFFRLWGGSQRTQREHANYTKDPRIELKNAEKKRKKSEISETGVAQSSPEEGEEG